MTYSLNDCGVGANAVEDPGGVQRPPPFSPNSLESPLNWLKKFKKILGAHLSSDPGSATASCEI